MLPVFPRAASAGPGLHPPVADGRISGRLPDAVPALEALFVRAVHQGLQKLCGNQPVAGTTSRRWRAGVRSLISTQAARVRTASARRRLEGVWKSARSYARATSSPPPTPSSAASVPRRPRSAEPTAAPAPRAQERVPATIDFSVRSLPRRRAALSVYIIRLKILKHEPRRRKHNSRFGAIPPRPAPA